MNRLFVIARNTFTEILRQPIYAVIIYTVLILFFFSPSVALLSLDDDNKLLREIGLSTLFLAGLFIAIFSASGAVAEEIDNKTIMTVLSKPVSRPIFILAKFFGVAAAVALAQFICTIALLMTIREGVLESVNDTYDWSVILTAGVILILSFIISAFFNYTYGWKLSSSAIVITAVLACLGILFLALIDENFKFNPQNNRINKLDIYGSILLFLAVMIFAALSVALSARFNIVVTLSACVGIFLLGLISDYVFGRFADVHLWAKIGRAVVPNIQVFWISDAIYEGSEVTIKYIIIGAFYGLCYSAGILSLAIALFQRRQVG
jgi:ABC-type transport system involved in multi-copper enzyme maturation permease subunit